MEGVLNCRYAYIFYRTKIILYIFLKWRFHNRSFRQNLLYIIIKSVDFPARGISSGLSHGRLNCNIRRHLDKALAFYYAITLHMTLGITFFKGFGETVIPLATESLSAIYSGCFRRYNSNLLVHIALHYCSFL